MEIKRATIEDAQAICDIRNTIVREGKVAIDKISTVDNEKMRISSLSDRETIFIIEENTNYLGFQSLTLLAKDIKRMQHVGELDTYILPDNRGKGLGKKLFENTLKFAKSKNYEKFVAFVRESNKISLKFHKNLGFKKVGRFSKQIKLNNNYDDEVILELFL